MKKITVIATPKAYEFLTDTKNKAATETIAQDILHFIKDGTVTECFSDTPLSISATWGKDETEENFILIYDGGHCLHNLNYEMFAEKLESGLLIHFDFDSIN